jgi:hypothetical protein
MLSEWSLFKARIKAHKAGSNQRPLLQLYIFLLFRLMSRFPQEINYSSTSCRLHRIFAHKLTD